MSGERRSSSAAGRPGRPSRTGSSAPELTGGEPLYVHVGDCWAGASVDGDRPRAGPASALDGVKPCPQCEPDNAGVSRLDRALVVLSLEQYQLLALGLRDAMGTWLGHRASIGFAVPLAAVLAAGNSTVVRAHAEPGKPTGRN
ncbi:DUF6233 domain-containing protein [Streptomyces sp. NPDC096205]|uniref:DUF6233 domain-containing protein n=1 Tax=Streptomyces sp. NPDC096205 TaxID=3366081 RepID=UPI00380B745B